FGELNGEEGTTLIVITHDPEVALRCSRRTRIEDGALREEAASDSAAEDAVPGH
ncbi:MAG: hypothetical protein OXN81_10155, partial [Alphaproteobacteria bacterium]|nr:hypothetical protein [Alphaproteobacteria bacterium]